MVACGSARWPTDIADGISQAYAAASKAAIPMKRGFATVEAITASVNEDICSGCGICASMCPYNAIQIETEQDKRVTSVITALCKGCGTCGAACPSGAISINQFKDEQITAQIVSLLGGSYR